MLELLSLAFLILFPMMVFVVIRRMFRIIRFIPKMFKEVIVPQYEKLSREGGIPTPDFDGSDNSNFFGYSRVQLEPEQIEFLKNSFFGKSMEVRPKHFRKITKKRLAIIGVGLGLLLVIITFVNLYPALRDYIVLTYL